MERARRHRAHPVLYRFAGTLLATAAASALRIASHGAYGISDRGCVNGRWLLQRPTVPTLVIGARTEEQLRDNLGAIGWNLTAEQIKRLDAVSAISRIYPYWHQQMFSERNPFPTG